jgi:hypothetical protein
VNYDLQARHFQERARAIPFPENGNQTDLAGVSISLLKTAVRSPEVSRGFRPMDFDGDDKGDFFIFKNCELLPV